MEIGKLLAWSYVTPVGAVWASASFFPVIGLLEADAGISALMTELFFLATGFVGLASLAFGLRLLVAPERRLDLPNPLKGKPAIIAIYTTLWLAAYAAFQMTA
ncbi:MAG: hypothetical protein K2P70_15975 [Hyphomonadaceae bacterium]|nr:hypothetical protein [Hyphomonadaceae bacterium]